MEKTPELPLVGNVWGWQRKLDTYPWGQEQARGAGVERQVVVKDPDTSNNDNKGFATPTMNVKRCRRGWAGLEFCLDLLIIFLGLNGLNPFKNCFAKTLYHPHKDIEDKGKPLYSDKRNQ